MKDYASSEATFRQLLEKYPDVPQAVEATYRVADCVMRQEGGPLRAIELYQSVLEKAPQGPLAGQALRGLAVAHYENKDYDRAAEFFDQLIREYPEVPLNEKAYAWLGERHYAAEQWELAGRAFDALLERVPDYPNPERIRFRVAECREKSGDAAGALELYARVAQDAPKSTAAVEARYRMAALHEQKGETEEALRLYEETSNSNSGDVAARACFRVAEICEKQEDAERAARNYMRVAILFLHAELSPEALLRAGRLYEKLGKPDQAKRTYEELVADFPDQPQAAPAREALAALGGT